MVSSLEQQAADVIAQLIDIITSDRVTIGNIPESVTSLNTLIATQAAKLVTIQTALDAANASVVGLTGQFGADEAQITKLKLEAQASADLIASDSTKLTAAQLAADTANTTLVKLQQDLADNAAALSAAIAKANAVVTPVPLPVVPVVVVPPVTPDSPPTAPVQGEPTPTPTPPLT